MLSVWIITTVLQNDSSRPLCLQKVNVDIIDCCYAARADLECNKELLAAWGIALRALRDVKGVDQDDMAWGMDDELWRISHVESSDSH